MDVFSIPGWDIKEIKEVNGIREISGRKKNCVTSKKFFFRIFIILTIVVLGVLYSGKIFPIIKEHFKESVVYLSSNEKQETIFEGEMLEEQEGMLTILQVVEDESNKLGKPILANDISNNTYSSKQTVKEDNSSEEIRRSSKMESGSNASNKEIFNQTVAINQNDSEESTKLSEKIQSAPKNEVIEKIENEEILAVSAPFANDYSQAKPWEVLTIIKNDIHANDNTQVLEALFNYLVSFEFGSNSNNLVAVWKTKKGSEKSISELFSYVVNASGLSGINKCYTVTSSNGKYWNEIYFSPGNRIIYDIANNKITTSLEPYQNGIRY